MSDDVNALIAEARTPVHSVELFGRTPAEANDLVRRLADALEAVQQTSVEGAGSCARDNVQDYAPAVDREALARHFYLRNSGRSSADFHYLMKRHHAGHDGLPAMSFAEADALFASGILQEAAYCATCQGPHRARAQQVREGN